MRSGTTLLITAAFAISLMAAQVGAADRTVTLMLGGKFCDSYLDDVDGALKKVAGVKSVDLKSMKGHAVVKVEPGKAKPEQLVAAVNGVKGSGWNCMAEVMK
jgi:mercuric ion binding protein